MKNYIILKREALTASLLTLDYQIKNCQPFYSRDQVRVWRVNRRKIFNQLKYLPTIAQIQAGAKRINYSNSPTR